MNQFLDQFLRTAHAANAEETDYINLDDGLLYCGKCHTPKEAFFEAGLTLGGSNKHPAVCRCAAEKRIAEEEAERRRKRENHIATLRKQVFHDIPGYTWKFENTDVMTAPLQTAYDYAERWDEMYENNIGLVLFGNVGTGKSYAAGCIANVLIDRCVNVGFLAMSDVVARIQGLWRDDRDRFMRSLVNYNLLILDDLGTERNTSYGRECVFDVINRRHLSGKPMIITTNIPLKYMQQTTDIEERRIFDRILECCIPLHFDCQNFRQVNRQENMKKAIQLLKNQ